MRRPIGYYVHHHGDGHRQRAISIGQALSGGVTLIGTGLLGRGGDLPVLDLPDDRLDGSFAGLDGTDRPTALHYAPVDHEGIRQRTARLTQWIACERPKLLVVDVSVEIAMLARLASVPTIYVRLSGKRLDTPHLGAFEGAIALLAPFDQALDDEQIPDWIQAKTYYAPSIIPVRDRAQEIERDVVLVVLGKGGGASDGDRWAAAARAVPNRLWRILGPCTMPSSSLPNLELWGWVEDADTLIATAGVVVGGAGDGVVSTVLASGRPFICLPEPRPFDEQVSKARRLEALGAAMISLDWPCPSDWPRLLEGAAKISNTPSRLYAASNGAARVAEWLERLAQGCSDNRSRQI